MQDTEQKKEPIEMTTDEALDYVFHPEIAERLRREAGKHDPPDEDECLTEEPKAD
jgi:hypothetical protein